MIKGRNIICLASAWDYDPTSKHQIMRRFSRNNHVLWVNYHGTRRPAATATDLRVICNRLSRAAHGVEPIHGSMAQLTPLVIPGMPGGLMGRAHRWLLTTQIRRALRATNGSPGKPVQVWSFAPDVPYLVGAFGEECFVYYCVDEYTEFEGYDRSRIVAAENKLLERADVIVTTSEALQESKSAVRPDATLVRHGVDFDHFASAWRSPGETPSELAPLDGPVFGFFGLLHHWIDYDLIAAVARQRPAYQFVLIGDRMVDVSATHGLPNVHFLGRRPYDRLPAYCAAFTAVLMPFTRTSMTRNVNPIKMLEYLAAGLPVISTSLPEARRFGGPVRIADTPEAFAAACDDVLRDAADADRAAIAATVEGCSWDGTVERLSSLVMDRVRSTAARERKHTNRRDARTPAIAPA